MGQPLFLFAISLIKPALVKRRIDCVEILRIEIILRDAEGIGNAVNMKYDNSKYAFVVFSIVILLEAISLESTD